MVLSSIYSALSLCAELSWLWIQIWFRMAEGAFRFIFPRAEKSVEGEIVLITGAGHGIGRELALQYGQLDTTVICVDLNGKTNEETATLVTNLKKRKAYSYTCDVSSEEEVKSLYNKVKSEVGIVTILVNNAGIMMCRNFFNYSSAEIHKLFDVNVFSQFWMLRTFLPDMIDLNQGHVITLSSMAGLLGTENAVPYCASKFAVNGLIQALSQEMRLSNPGNEVKFTTIYPYIVDTGLCKKPVIRFPTLMRMITPEEAAKDIIQASRRDIEERSIPFILLTMNSVFRLLPVKIPYLIKDFLGTTIEDEEKVE